MIQVGCILFDQAGAVVKNFPGQICYFRANGERVEVDDEKMNYLDAEDNIIWSQKGSYHHQIKVDENQKIIAALSETKHNVLGCETRYDTIEVINMADGKKKKIVDFFDLFKDETIFSGTDLTYLIKANYKKTQKSYMCDTTHLNSLFQITENVLGKTNKIFSPGNWLVNFSINGQILIFDKNFEKVIWRRHVAIKRDHFHDIQFSKEGKILLYLNRYIKQDGASEVTALAEVDPIETTKLGIKIIELRNEGKLFRQNITGGMQFLLDGKKMVSIYDDTQGHQLGIYDKNWKLTKKITPFPASKNKFGMNFQEARMINLTNFFKNYKGQH